MDIREKIIIDTDIGDDADDALAISLALRSPELEVKGITTVFRNTVARAKITKRLIGILGHNDIPVYAGIGHPIINEADTEVLPIQFLDDMATIEIASDVTAVDFLYRSIMENRNEITLVPIGPLTNIAALFMLHPDSVKYIKRIVMMGGAFYFHYDEWNIFCDPEAASVVLSSGVPIYAVGLDATLRCPVTEELYQEIRAHGSPITDLLGELLRRYKEARGRHTFLHDPSAIISLIKPELFQFSSEDIVVELKGVFTRGMTFRKSKIGVHTIPDRNIFCASSVDNEGVLATFRERILG